MTSYQKIVVFAIALSVAAFIVELVRRKKLREEYSVLWIATAAAITAVAAWDAPLALIKRAIGAEIASNAIFFLGIMFLLVLNVYFSVKVSLLTHRSIRLAQRVALLEERVHEPGGARDAA
ncbi:MAG: DUF2304 domain-containing protein [Deltaproteobacteria bacterium]|nr:DUF2304 domain-containing protein [Deltaproteobacteria bacterium]